MMRYNPTELEVKWQEKWTDGRYNAVESSDKQKYYISCMFPCPSGARMHIGHTMEHAIVDALARYHRANGKEVLNPMGWDAFGLPSEGYAIKNNITPQEATSVNIDFFRKTLKRLGASLDWSREIDTSSVEYYKWTQWIFAEFYKRGLAYQKYAHQWWCDYDKTVLANEQVEAGRCVRCDSVVVKKPMNQWFFKITDYADKLVENLDQLDWPNKIKIAQKNWVGKSEGVEVTFDIGSDKVNVFTTRVDTLYGVSALLLAPEHDLVNKITLNENKQKVQKYVTEALKLSEIERMTDKSQKTGVFTGAYAVHPMSGKKVPVWVADYVLASYGTGALMLVPSHDERDAEFAKQHSLEIVQVVENKNQDENGFTIEKGVLVNSEKYSGMTSDEAKQAMVKDLEAAQKGKEQVTYKMRDWLLSRQRYWGAPIPIVYVDGYEPIAVAESCLPIELPEPKGFKEHGSGWVLKNSEDWVNVWVNVKTGETVSITKPKPEGDDWKKGKREVDTMDGYLCSSWYLLRYTDPHNSKQAWSPEKANYWSPVDEYVGGDHAVAHLLYVRFWYYVFQEMGLVNSDEPIKSLTYHGYVLAENGEKMSKSKGNVVDPMEVIDQGYGADSLKMFLLYAAPITDNYCWSTNGMVGIYRFLNRFWNLANEVLATENSGELSKETEKILHKTIKKVSEDTASKSFNTAIASLIEITNYLYKEKVENLNDSWKLMMQTLIQLLAVYAPHMCAELWQMYGNSDNLDFESWPVYDKAKLESDNMKLAVQVNGKLRATTELPKSTPEDEVKQHCLELENVQKHLDGKSPKKVLFIKQKIVSIIV